MYDGAKIWRQTSTMSSDSVYRTSLRLDRGTYQRIEQIRTRDGDKLPLSAWLERAVLEQLKRDERDVTADIPPTLNYIDSAKPFRFYEFFAGGGMARAGLGQQWECVFANDFDPMKARTYRDNWHGGHELIVGDVNRLQVGDLPTPVDMAWASFPCQDLSLAGNYEGIGHSESEVQTRSGSFWAFWRLMQSLRRQEAHPRLIVLENVYGILTANQGRDFAAIGASFADLDYTFGAIVMDARHFVPQSRPRVFIVGVSRDSRIPEDLIAAGPDKLWHPARMVEAHSKLDSKTRESWRWWALPAPPPRTIDFIDVIEDEPTGVNWHTPSETKKILSMMSELNLAKLKAAQKTGQRMVGGIYKRTRVDANGNKVQRAEVRFDSISGCLRTPAGGSSRQSILVVEGKKVRSRLLSPREAARLMGLPDSYVLPRNYNDAYHVAGDGVAVPCVSYLARNLFERILSANG